MCESESIQNECCVGISGCRWSFSLGCYADLTGLLQNFQRLAEKNTIFELLVWRRSLLIQALDMDGWVGVVNPSHFPSILLNPLPIAQLLFTVGLARCHLSFGLRMWINSSVNYWIPPSPTSSPKDASPPPTLCWIISSTCLGGVGHGWGWAGRDRRQKTILESWALLENAMADRD